MEHFPLTSRERKRKIDNNEIDNNVSSNSWTQNRNSLKSLHSISSEQNLDLTEIKTDENTSSDIIIDDNIVDISDENLGLSELQKESIQADDWRNGGHSLFIDNIPPIMLTDTIVAKMKGLNSFNNPSLFDKNSAEYRLFASTVYDLGKILYYHAPNMKDIKDRVVVNFLTYCIEGFIMQFPYLSHCKSKDFSVAGLSIVGFIKDRVKGAFKKVMRVNQRGHQ